MRKSKEYSLSYSPLATTAAELFHFMQKKPQAIDVDVPLDQLAQLVSGYQHRVLSLEAELQEHARGGALNEGDFSRRMRAIHALNSDLQELSNWAKSQTGTDVTHKDIGLPLMGMCTPVEAQVCALYIKEKGSQLKSLRRNVAQVHNWLKDCFGGRVGALRQTLRLSKLRQMIVDTDRKIESLREREVLLTRQVHALMEQSPKGRDLGLTTLKALQTLFSRIDTSTQRIAKLTATIKREELRTLEMRAWLEKERRDRAQRWPSMEPPTPMALARAIATTGYDMRSLGSNDRRQRILLDQYYQDAKVPIQGGASLSAANQAESVLAEVLP